MKFDLIKNLSNAFGISDFESEVGEIVTEYVSCG